MQYVKVYHLSPHASIQRFTGQYSQKMRAHGIFVSESWQSILDDWLPTLRSKRYGKRKKSTLEKRKRRLRRQLDLWEDTELEDSREYQAKEKQISRYWRGTEHSAHHNLTVYTLLIPKDIFDACQQRMTDLADAAFERSGMSAYGAWGWGVETFILDEFLDQIIIVGRRTLIHGQMMDLMDRNSSEHRVQIQNIHQKMIDYNQEADRLIQHFGPAPLLVRAKRYVQKFLDSGHPTDIRNVSRHYKVLDGLMAPYQRQIS